MFTGLFFSTVSALLYGVAATVQYTLDFLEQTTPVDHPWPAKTPAQMLGMA